MDLPLLRRSIMRCRDAIGVLLFVTIVQGAAYSQSNIIAKFVPRSHTYNGTTLPYRLFIPDNYSPLVRYPVVLALHGSGERGTDNLVQIQNNGLATSWADPANQAMHPCFVVVPQCPATGSWANGVLPITRELATANNILDSLAREFSIDTDRMYVTGLSLGGYGTWELINQYPERFAAAIPMSAGLFAAYASRIVKMPIWNFHGTVDNVVPVDQSRAIISALEALGRTAVYTHSHYGDGSRLPDSTVLQRIDEHADLFYTEYQTGGHVIWVESYTYPPLMKWVFNQVRLNTHAFTLSTLQSRRTLSGTETIRWATADTAGTVEIWFSSDAGRSWKQLEAHAPNTGSYQWNTASVADCSFGQLTLFLTDSSSRVLGSVRSAFFSVKNTTNGPAFASLLIDEQTYATPLIMDSVDVKYLLGDPEWAELSAELSYSADGGRTYQMLSSYSEKADTVARTRRIGLGQIPNSRQAVLKITASDGQSISSDSSRPFMKFTPRSQGPKTAHTSGGGGTVVVHIVNAKELTGHHYRVAFSQTPAAKFYSVTDLDRNAAVVVDHAEAMDGVTEGPIFDGLALVVHDYTTVAADIDSSRWVTGASTLPASISLPEFTLGTETIKGRAVPFDYLITLSDAVVDTSKDLYGAVPVPMKFSVWNVTRNVKTDVIFDDADGNQTISSLDALYIIEPDSTQAPALGWQIQFIANPRSTLPVPGDQFLLKTHKPITAQDVFTFSGFVTSVAASNTPEQYALDQNFPNPFNPSTTITYRLARASMVRLAVYDILGREVAVLVNHPESAGAHRVAFNARTLSSGMYFCRLQAGPYSDVRKLLLVR